MSIFKVSLAAIAAGMFASSVYAADLIVVDPVVDMASPKAHDVYVGILGSVGQTTGFPVYGGVGVTIGADVDLTDVVFLGAEVRGNAFWDNTGYLGFEVMGQGRIGFHATDAVDLYLGVGAGHFSAVVAANSNSYYIVSAGAEFEVDENWAIRTEIAASGPFSAGPNTYQATAGVLWSF